LIKHIKNTDINTNNQKTTVISRMTSLYVHMTPETDRMYFTRAGELRVEIIGSQ